jgi:hypothetical protein
MVQMQMLKRFMKRHNKDEGLQQELNGCLLGPHEQRTLSSKAENEPKENCEIIFFGGPHKDELAQPAYFTVLEITSRNQGSELSSATMTPQWLW